ncbi:DNA cytosine methyltransferase [Bradyrhizobium yuanmingense]|uniref:DNA cytosine methyltransferase n=1 Tax=Bradyrhizobium yuanmingense TaxID=108015 RepID=UPI000FE42E5A|nr:DNA cytosine methyltransferase [Bradyrhizobium yuanmingense]TGN73467.1 DNA cytosine methyltransferase [Bradyrhizobium yuanmingense]
MRKFSAISLYTGAGGLDYGFEAAGFRTAVAVEMDQRCAETIRLNRKWSVINDDISAVATADILAKAKLRRREADILIGGPPCQPFSKAGFWATGSTKRLQDPRASTLENYLRVLEDAKPRTFLLENVEGLGFRGKDEGLKYFRSRLQAINARQRTNYVLSTAVLNAVDYGVPQLRRRLFIVGCREGRSFIFPGATHVAADELLGDRQRHLTAWDALRSIRVLKSEHESLRLRGKWADLLPTIPEGQNYLWHTQRGGGQPLFGWRRRYWSFLLKLSKNAPSWTISAQPGPATGPFHWDNRRLSVREMARLQTFPAIRLAGSHSDCQRQLGNAVPSLLAEILAREIGAQLLGRSIRGGYALSIDPSKTAPPLAIAPAPVPTRYLSLRGDHDAHPGTGKGYRASLRSASFGSNAQEVFELGS